MSQTSTDPSPPVRWRPRTFAAISVFVSFIAVFWAHIEIVRHNEHAAYADALAMVVRSNRWWFDALLAAALVPFYFLSIWSWWRLWRHTLTKVLGTLIAAIFVRQIVVSLAASPATLLRDSPALLIAMTVLASAYAIPIGLWIAWWVSRTVGKVIAP